VIRAVLYNNTGGPEQLYVAEIPSDDPGQGEVAVTVKAAGLNPYDAKARAGIAPVADVAFPRGVGSDFAGIVSALGPGVSYADGTPVTLGDEVLGWGPGTLRERLIVPAVQLARKPAALSWTVAGSLSTPGQTAMACLNVLPVGRGDTVLVSAAAGAVGFIIGQLAVRAGARVIGTASDVNHERLSSVGVEPIEYGPGLEERVRAIAPDGITAVFENHGREAVDAALALGVPPSQVCAIVDHALTAELGLVTPGRYERRADVLQDLADRAAVGALMLPVQQEFPLDAVQDAFRLLEGRHLTGKVVITP
jgi:NADPH:quinone reductase-like Zn-dependent oxidoreductase